MTEISNSDEIIRVSDITDRVDELRKERAESDQETGVKRDEDGKVNWGTEDGEPIQGSWEAENPDEADELERLEKLLDELRGRGTSHDWGGDTYPDVLIADSHFPEYAQELAEDIGAIQRGVSWIVIDWEATANGLKQDFRSVDFDGAEYWHRS